MNIYFISGLGADERIFQKIRLPKGYEIRHIPWQPARAEQSIASYARQMANSIDANKPFMLAGLSFGGMIASEICKFLKPEKLILFSSVKTAAELPALYRLAGKLGLYKIIPGKIYKLTLPFLHWFLGVSDNAGRLLLSSFLDHTDPFFLRWAIREISCWKNTTVFQPQLHIHGDRDRVFPIDLVAGVQTVTGGSHFSVFNDADHINEILARELPAEVRMTIVPERADK